MRLHSRSTGSRRCLSRPAVSRRAVACALVSVGVLSLALSIPSMAIAGGRGLAANQCALAMGWFTSVRAPNGSNPYAAYGAYALKGSTQTPLDSVAIVMTQRYPAASYGGYFLYPNTYQLPTDGATYPKIKPNTGSVNPYTVGTPIFARKRGYTIIVTADSVAQNALPGSLRNIPNRITWPQMSTGFTMLDRTYGGKAGYDRGGTGGPLKISWPDVRTYDIKTGKPVDCGNVQPSRNLVQRITPWNTKGAAGFDHVPGSFGALFPGMRASKALYPPKPDTRLLQFFRLPANGTGLPGGVVPPPVPDACANYLTARLNQRQIALFRVPKVPSFQPTSPAAGATYSQTDTSFYTFSIQGRLREQFHPRSAYNYALGAEDIKTDPSGGATFVIWPRSLNRRQQAAVFALARARGWNLLEGNGNSPGAYADSIWLRVNGPASTYIGGTYPTPSRSGVPCMNGPQSVLSSYPATSALTMVPPGTGYNTLAADWAAVPSMMGSATPQGVECRLLDYMSGTCLRRLKSHIADTGGSFTAH
jgi:hypothetical protein